MKARISSPVVLLNRGQLNNNISDVDDKMRRLMIFPNEVVVGLSQLCVSQSPPDKSHRGAYVNEVFAELWFS